MLWAFVIGTGAPAPADRSLWGVGPSGQTEHGNFSLQLQPPGGSALIGLEGRAGAHTWMRNLRLALCSQGQSCGKKETAAGATGAQKDHEQPRGSVLLSDDRRNFPWWFLSTSWPGRASDPRAGAVTTLSMSRPLQVLDLPSARAMPQGKRHSLRVCEYMFGPLQTSAHYKHL